VQNANIESEQVDWRCIAPNSVNTYQLSANAVYEENILDDAVTTSKVKDLNITVDKLALSATSSDQISGDSIRTDHYKDLSVTTAKLANDSVTDEKLEATGVAAATYGNNATTPTFTVNTKGRITSATNITIQKWYDQYPTAGGDLDGTYPNPDIRAGVIVNADINNQAAIQDTKLATIATAGKVSNSATTGVTAATPETLMLRNPAGDVEINKLTALDDVIVSSSSDIRYKENVNRMTGSLLKLGKIRGVEYDWNGKQTSYTGHDYGVIAQEVEEVLPEAVVTRESGYKAVRYERLIPLLIESIKELEARVRELES
jgi:hypothetical protein